MKRKQLIAVFMMFIFFSTIFCTGETVNATPYKSGYAYGGKTKIGKVIFKGEANGDKYNIIRVKNDASKTILKKIDGEYITNGKKLFYSKNSTKLYSYNIKSKKSKFVLKVKNDGMTSVTPKNAKGNYVYYTKNIEVDQSLYVYNTKTKKKKRMVSGIPNKVTIKGKKVYVRMQTFDIDEPITYYVFSLSGKKLRSYTK